MLTVTEQKITELLESNVVSMEDGSGAVSFNEKLTKWVIVLATNVMDAETFASLLDAISPNLRQYHLKTWPIDEEAGTVKFELHRNRVRYERKAKV